MRYYINYNKFGGSLPELDQTELNNKLLISRGVSLSETYYNDYEGDFTLVTFASPLNLRLLLKYGADLNSLAGEYTPLGSTIRNGDLERINLLFDLGVNVNLPITK
jgi:hypothetical protein